MKILFLGAGGTGGYFGGRLAEAGADVTFLLRDRRAEQVRSQGLSIRSLLGDAVVHPRVITQKEIDSPYDLIVLTCKHYDLDAAIQTIRPAVGDNTLILPILNGLPHYQKLEAAFSAHRVLGGLCHIMASLGETGEIIHFSPLASITFGIRRGTAIDPSRCKEIERIFHLTALFKTTLSDQIEQASWEKLSMLTTLAASTCLMRSSIDQIMATRFGPTFLTLLHDEAESIAAAEGYPIRPEAHALSEGLVLNPESTATSSMLRDMEQYFLVEADAILGDMVDRALCHQLPVLLLKTAYCHLQIYQNQLTRKIS